MGWSLPAGELAMPIRHSYSELEFIILALIREGTLSGYSMRKRIAQMPGIRWSADSGSVYRTLRRLESDKLVSEIGKTGVPRRERTEFALTALGESALKSWLQSLPTVTDFAMLVDPVRTRVHFLTMLENKDKVRVIRGWLEASKQAVQHWVDTCSRLDPQANFCDYQVTREMVLLSEARHEWLRKMLATVRTQMSG